MGNGLLLNETPLAQIKENKMKRLFFLLPMVALLFIGCSSPTDSNADVDFDDNNDNGDGPNPTPAKVVKQETGVSYSGVSASMSYRLSNTGETTAYNVQYSLTLSYQCNTGLVSNPTTELLPSPSSLYSYGNIDAGQIVDFNDSIQLCSGLGIVQFTFEVSTVIWD